MPDLLNVYFRTVTPPANLPHLSAADEILRLPKYLQAVIQSTSEQMAFVNMGTLPPSGPAASWPWFKQGSDGQPVDILVNVGGQWVPAVSGLDKKLTMVEANMGVRMGNSSITIPATADPDTTNVFVGTVLNYTGVFIEEPMPFITPKFHTSYSSVANSYGLRTLASVDHTAKEFKVVVVYRPSGAADLAAEVTVPFSWMLIGRTA